MASGFMRLLIVVHRYLGVAVGLLMAMWCLSGFVMMYQGYPKLSVSDRIEALSPLRMTQPQATAINIADNDRLTGFSLEMMAGRPVLHLERGPRDHDILDLATGQPLKTVTAVEALRVAEAYARQHGIVGGQPGDYGVIDVDQWTLDGVNRAGPMHRILYNDPEGTELYVSTVTGEAVQVTNARTRLLAWLGAIPHWLYPTMLRNNPAAWDAVVVWTSLVGTFLTAIGLYVGIARFRRYTGGRWSPYRGWFYWHHIVGLVFGVLTLTWVGSGLLTMGPFGLMESDAGVKERGRITGEMSGAEVRRFLVTGAPFLTGDLVQLRAAPLGGKLYVMAVDRFAHSVRLDAQGQPAPMPPGEALAALKGAVGAPVAAFERIDHEDAYYYSGYDGGAPLPAYRARLADAQSTTYYLDGKTGRLLRAIDDAGRQSRWIRYGLHDFDFPGLRARPLWDVVVWILLLGVTAVCVTGVWMSWLRVKLDVGRLLRRP